MTDHSDIEREVADLGESVLEDLDPEQRAQLVIELTAAGDFEKTETVKEAAPVKTYRTRDLAFHDALSDNVIMALYAMYELDSAAWRFHLERVQGELDAAHYELYPDADWTEEPTEANGFHEQAAKDAAAEFLGTYLAWERYSEEDVGIELETFLMHPFGGTVSAAVSSITFLACIADGSLFAEEREDANPEGWADGGTVTVDGEELTAQELAHLKYNRITSEEAPPL